MKKILTTLIILSGLLAGLKKANAESDCNCSLGNKPTAGLSTLIQKLELASKLGEEDFFRGLKDRYDELVGLKNKAKGSAQVVDPKLKTEIDQSESKLYDYLDKNRNLKLNPDSGTTSLILDSIYEGNSVIINDEYGYLLLDYYKKNEKLFAEMLKKLNTESNKNKYEVLSSMYTDAITAPTE